MKFKKIKNLAFLGLGISCLASFSFGSQTVEFNQKDVSGGFEKIIDYYFQIMNFKSAYTPDFVFLKELAKSHGLSVPNFDETSYIDMDLESERALEFMLLLKEQVPDFELFDNAILGDGFSKEMLSSVHRRLLALPNGAKLVELFDQVANSRYRIYSTELRSLLKKSYPEFWNRYFISPSSKDNVEEDNPQWTALMAIIDRIFVLEDRFFSDFSEHTFEDIKQELKKLPNSAKVIELFDIFFENEIKPYRDDLKNQVKFRNMLMNSIYSTGDITNKSVQPPISKFDFFFITTARLRPYSERAKLILEKLDKTGELNRLYDGFFS